ncbi:AAA family ATPase [Streptococcus suis]|nr:AAA family ATPase [Streptococcus suis]
MRIDEVKISGYRRFQDSTINLEHGSFAILAGANNSGKTSLIQLLDFIFNNSSRKTVRFNDFSIEMKKLLDQKLEELNIDLNNHEKEFLEFLNFIEKNIKISVKLCISYKKDESIGLFANYLMDLEEEMASFFFEYVFKFDIDKIKNDFTKAEVRSKYELRTIIENSVGSKYYYSDKDFLNRKEIEYNEFKRLFNFEYISADRELDDENLKNKKITTTILSSTDPKKLSLNWEKEFNRLESTMQKTLTESGVKEKFQERTVEALEDLKKNLDDVSKNEIDALRAEFDFNGKTLLNLLKNSLYISYAHQSGDFLFNLTEESQGLGISNLIFISLQINNFARKIEQLGTNTVNFFVIEEPEAHMHIQMQKVLVDYIETIFKDNGNIQGIITTHSTEIVKNVEVKNIKVIRPEKDYMNRIVDLHQFIKKNGDNEFYETFFKLNFADLIFSDAVIFYEGDAERMYFDSLITRKNTQYHSLSKQYISYCQCGGAYAHKYFSLLNELKIKSCVFTDIDYDKDRDSLEEIMEDTSTNATLNLLLDDDEKNVGGIYKQQFPISERQNMIEIFTQTSNDGYARTLEDALLFKMISATRKIEHVFEEFDKDSWNSFNQTFKLILPKITPHKEWKMRREEIYNQLNLKKSNRNINYLKENHPVEYDQYEEFKKDCNPMRSIRDLVSVLDKTNFMYSIIMNNKEMEVLPNYIEEGLSWLNQQISIG